MILKAVEFLFFSWVCFFSARPCTFFRTLLTRNIELTWCGLTELFTLKVLSPVLNLRQLDHCTFKINQHNSHSAFALTMNYALSGFQSLALVATCWVLFMGHLSFFACTSGWGLHLAWTFKLWIHEGSVWPFLVKTWHTLKKLKICQRKAKVTQPESLLSTGQNIVYLLQLVLLNNCAARKQPLFVLPALQSILQFFSHNTLVKKGCREREEKFH